MNWDNATIILAGISTIAIFSFLIKENKFYRFFEHLFIGIASGLGVIITIKNFLYPKIFVPLLGLDIVYFPDGSTNKEYDYNLLLFLIPILFGLLYYFIYSKKHAWLSKLVIGFSLGVSAGLAFKGFFNRVIPQITQSFKPLIVVDEGKVNLFASLNNSFFILTLITVMYYFFFSFKRSKSAEKFSYFGRFLMMICFGAFFGSTVMARLALLVERVSFLYKDFYKTLINLI